MKNKVRNSQKIEGRRKFLAIRLSAWIEMISFFFVLFIIAFLFGIEFNYFNVSLHPFWILVILMSAQYGINEGLMAACISSIILLIGPLPPQSVMEDRYEYFFILAKMPIFWFISAVILGELRMRHIRERDKLKEEALQAEEKEKKVAESYEALKKIKELLEMRVSSDRQTALMEIAAFKELEEGSKEDIIRGACDLTKVLVAPEKFSIFLLESRELKYRVSEGWDPDDHYLKSFGPDSALFQEIVEKKKVISIQTTDHKVLGEEGVLAVPIIAIKSGKVLGMIKIEEIPFLRLRTTEIESLHMIGEWVGTAYANFLKKEQKNEKEE
jgi:polysaccharide biosynthesis protein PelD